MQTIPQEQVVKRFQALPDALKDAIFSQKTVDAILKYAVLRDVPEDKIYFVGALASDVLLGYLRPENFASEIQKETGVDGLKATQVAHDIDTEIFSSVRLELKKLYPPTIQTPTVQSQGFVYQAPQAPAAAARHAPEPARPYVVPIPEKFRAKSAWSQKNESGITNQESGIKEPMGKENEELGIRNYESEIKNGGEKPAAPPQNIPPNKAIDAAPPIKPIVPLPTFIQSKFKETLKQTTGEKRTTQEDQALKNAFTKFTTPHTEAKPTERKPQESIYREPISEPEKPQGNQRSGEDQQKAEGKVIDLSGL